MSKTIGVISLKGGVGKTSTVIALGDALADFGKRVLLVDANFNAPNLGLHLDIVDPENTLHHVLNRQLSPKEAVVRLDKFDVIPASIFHRMNINPLKLKDKLKYFKENYDVVLIDSAPSLNEEVLSVLNASDEVLVVTTPDVPTLSMTLKSLKLANQHGLSINGLILNKVHKKNFELSLDELENTLEVPIMAVIPHDINFLKSVANFKPLTQQNPRGEASREYRKLAGTLIGERYKDKRIREFFSRITPNRQEINREIFYESYF